MPKRTFGSTLWALASALVLSIGTALAAPAPLPGKIIISGASGGLAGETIEALLTRGVKPSDLILVTRTPEKLAALAEGGASVRRGDFNEPASLASAFAGGDRMLLVSVGGAGARGNRQAQHAAAIDAAKRAGVRLIVYTGYMKGADGKPAGGLATDHRATEELLKNSGVAWTVLGNGLYNEGLMAQGQRAIATGEIVSNAGDGKWAPVARKDCAAAAAAVLTTKGHENKFYNITGPALISNADFARLLTEVTGKPVKYVALDDEAYVERLQAGGMPEQFARMSAAFSSATRSGELAIVSSAVRDLTGHEPQSVRQFLEANKAKLLAPLTASAPP
jgi:NAD(P)H dehydrogenase (quinone)